MTTTDPVSIDIIDKDSFAIIIRSIPKEEQIPLLFVCKRWRDTCRLLIRSCEWLGMNLQKRTISRKGVVATEWFTTVAARKGYLDLFRWAIKNKCPISKNLAKEVESCKNIEMLQFLMEMRPQYKADCGFYAISRASFKGDISMIESLLEKGLTLSGRSYYQLMRNPCAMAAKGGQFDCLKWLVSKGCPIDDCTVREALIIGRLDIAEWSKEQGCSLTWQASSMVDGTKIDISMATWMKGNLPHLHWHRYFMQQMDLNLLDWGLENGLNSSATIMTAIQTGNLEVLHWLKEKKIFTFQKSPYPHAIVQSENAIDVLNLLIEFDVEVKSIQQDVIASAMEKENLCRSLLEWIDQHGHIDANNLLYLACTYGNIEAMKFALEKKGKWGRGGFGNVKALKFALRNGYKLKKQTCFNSIELGDLDVIIFARENGCPWAVNKCLKEARRVERYEMFMWILKNAGESSLNEDSHRYIKSFI